MANSRYTIQRECWSERTFNGYEDNPYWKITLAGNIGIGLKDNGEFWMFDGREVSNSYINALKSIVDECKLKIII